MQLFVSGSSLKPVPYSTEVPVQRIIKYVCAFLLFLNFACQRVITGTRARLLRSQSGMAHTPRSYALAAPNRQPNRAPIT